MATVQEGLDATRAYTRGFEEGSRHEFERGLRAALEAVNNVPSIEDDPDLEPSTYEIQFWQVGVAMAGAAIERLLEEAGRE